MSGYEDEMSGEWLTRVSDVSEVAYERDRPVKGRLREDVIERDCSCCRVCGRYVEYPALHHIEYRSEGGRDELNNLVTIGWQPGHDCHLQVVHANKKLWQPILKVIVATPGVTGLQIRRWGEV
jgi:5-methylcytosine-specific restriction endonuclease McrA